MADGLKRWDELLPVLTLAYNSQPHRSTGLAPFELVMLRRIPNLSFQNLPPGMQVHDKEILKDGSSRVSKRQFMAQVCQRILTVVHAQRSSLQLYKRNYIANVSARNRDIRIRYYVYTTNHARPHKSRSAAVGPFAVLDADIVTYISDMVRQDCNSIAAATTIVDPRVDLP